VIECTNCGCEWEYDPDDEASAVCPQCGSEVEVQGTSENIVPERNIEDILDRHPRDKSSLIPILQETQDQYGYLPRDVTGRIGEYLGMEESKIYGVATFYAQFRFEPQGEHVVLVCHGTACHVKDAEGITDTLEDTLGIGTGETTDDGMFTLERVACLGCCSLAPVIMVDDTTHGNLTREKAREVIEEYRESEAREVEA